MVSIHLEAEDQFWFRFFPTTEIEGTFPDEVKVKTVGCVLYLGEIPVFFRSPAQMCEAVQKLREASDKWQDELLSVSRLGDDYVLAPYETPVSHRDDLADEGLDREAC